MDVVQRINVNAYDLIRQKKNQGECQHFKTSNV